MENSKHKQYVQFPTGEITVKMEPNYTYCNTFEEAQRERDHLRHFYLVTRAIDIPYNKIPKII